MEKKEAVNIIIKCAKEYKNNLENKNLLFVFRSAEKKSQFEAVFLSRNYLHLTGIVPTPRRFSSANDFYRICINNKLKETDFEFASNGTTELKVLMLMQMMNIHKSAKMVGEYNFIKSLLYTEKMAGNIFGCMGFVREGQFYIPNTVIKEDIRNITLKPQYRVTAILRKNIKDQKYKEVTYLAKGVSLEEIELHQIKKEERKPLDQLLQEAKATRRELQDTKSKFPFMKKEDREK